MKARPGRVARQLAVVSCALVALAGCSSSPPPQVVVVNNTPPADSGMPVLLTVMIGVAFVAAGIAGVFAWIATNERSRRRMAEAAQRLAEDRLLVVSDRAGARAGYDLPEAGIPSAQPSGHYRARSENLRHPAIERGLA